jgi:HSP20 family protein
MAIQKYKPLSLLDQLQREMSTLFTPSIVANFSPEEWAPAVDIRDEDDKFVIHADLPGVKTEDIDVSVDNGVLTIKGVRENVKEEEKDSYKRIERFNGSFMRRFTLPDGANLDKISAKTKNGVLDLTVPKTAKTKPKRIDIKVEK